MTTAATLQPQTKQPQQEKQSEFELTMSMLGNRVMSLKQSKNKSKGTAGGTPVSSGTLRAVWSRHEAAALAEEACVQNLDAYATFLETALADSLSAYLQDVKPKRE